MSERGYRHSPLLAFGRADAGAINAELAKIAVAIEALHARIDAAPLGSGGQQLYAAKAFADSDDGTVNFTTEAQGDRTHMGLALNKATAEPPQDPAQYDWMRIKGADGADAPTPADGEDGAPGAPGPFLDWRFARSFAPPAPAQGSAAPGYSQTIPAGDGFVWAVTAYRDAQSGAMLSAWSEPARLTSATLPQSYDAARSYYEGEQVLFAGGTYIAITPEVTGTAPSGSDQHNGFWAVVAAPGTSGTPAVPPSGFVGEVTVNTTSAGANLRTLADAAGYTGMSDATITFVVPANVTVRGTGSGGIGIDTGTWPTGHTVSLSLVVASGARVFGGGGKGGAGGSGGPGQPGGNGGDAIFVRHPIAITVEETGEVRGGGGGGHGGAGTSVTVLGPRGDTYYSYRPELGYDENTGDTGDNVIRAGGGGGGGGFPNGLAGVGGAGDTQSGTVGARGNLSGGGAGGTGVNPGGAGGDAATAGAPGGLPGAAIRRNGHAVALVNNGTIAGAQA